MPIVAFSPARRARVFAALVGLFLSACGSSSSPPRTTSVSLAKAVKKTEQIPRGQLNVVVSATRGGQSVTVLAYHYLFDQGRKLMAVTADYRNLAWLQPGSLGGLNAADLVFRVIVDRRRSLTLYMSTPLFLEARFQTKLPDSARHRAWVRFGAAELEKAARTGLVPAGGIAAAARTSSPLVFLDALSASNARVKRAARIAGVATTVFSTTTSMARVGMFGELITQAGAARQWAAEAWVSGDLLIRRVRFSSPPIASLGNATLTLTSAPRALGKPVTINEPPGDATFDFSALPR